MQYLLGFGYEHIDAQAELNGILSKKSTCGGMKNFTNNHLLRFPMSNDAREIFKDWINSPRYRSKLTFELRDSSNDYDEYTIVGLTSRLKWVVGCDCVDIWFDFSGIIESSDELVDINCVFHQGHTITADNYYIINSPSSDTVKKYPSLYELVIDECAHGIALIEGKIQKHSYIVISACNHGGSSAHIMPVIELEAYVNRMLSKRCRQDPAAVTYPHVYFAPLVKKNTEL
jgi:hypothetical protein